MRLTLLVPASQGSTCQPWGLMWDTCGVSKFMGWDSICEGLGRGDLVASQGHVITKLSNVPAEISHQSVPIGHSPVLVTGP